MISSKRLCTMVALGLCAAACSSDGGNAPLDRTRQAIVSGSASDESQDSTVMLLRLDPEGPRRVGICTAALVAPRLVLTARHCVATTDDVVACNADGTPLIGAKILADERPENLFVFTGKTRPDFIGVSPPSLDTARWKPSGQGLELLHDASETLCDHDLALLLLKEPIEGVPLASLRLDGDVAVSDKLVTVGWGVTFGEVEPSTRQTRRGVNVDRVGPNESLPVLTKSEFLFDESICSGDSGGPVFAEATGAIVGVVSRGGNGLDPNQGGPSATCEGADNVATKLSPFRELIVDAFERAGAAPKLEQRADEGCSASPLGAAGLRRGGDFALGIGLAIAALLRRSTRR